MGQGNMSCLMCSALVTRVGTPACCLAQTKEKMDKHVGGGFEFFFVAQKSIGVAKPSLCNVLHSGVHLNRRQVPDGCLAATHPNENTRRDKARLPLSCHVRRREGDISKECA